MSGANDELSDEGLRSRYPQLAKRGGASQLLQKRLCKGHKYFDSGDYNVARAQHSQKALSGAGTGVGGASAAAANVLPTQKEESSILTTTGDTIATPETVSAVRKKSLQQQLHHHHQQQQVSLATVAAGCPLVMGSSGIGAVTVVRETDAIEDGGDY